MQPAAHALRILPARSDAAVLGWFARAHAVAMLFAAATSLVFGAWLAAAAGALSLAACATLERGRWTPSGRFGAANAVTSLRVLLTAALGALCIEPPGPAAAILVLAIFALDAADGRLARTRGESSLFGAYFDLECDAYLVLVCALALHQHGRLPAFVLIPGVLRYVYVLIVMFVHSPGGGENPRGRLGRNAFGALVVSLIASLWPLPLHAPFALFSTLLIAYSFACSIRALYRPA